MTEFHDLYVRYAGDVHRFVTYLTGDPAAADDITSETFLRAWTSSSPIREDTVKSYLFTIARHLVLKEWRRTARFEALPDDVAAALPSQATQVDAQSEAQTTLRRVLKALRGMPAVDRAALLLRVRDGLSYEEIAAALDLSLSNAKVKVHRARLKLAALA